MERNKDFFVNSTNKRDKSFFVKDYKAPQTKVATTEANIEQGANPRDAYKGMLANPNTSVVPVAQPQTGEQFLQQLKTKTQMSNERAMPQIQKKFETQRLEEEKTKLEKEINTQKAYMAANDKAYKDLMASGLYSDVAQNSLAQKTNAENKVAELQKQLDQINAKIKVNTIDEETKKYRDTNKDTFFGRAETNYDISALQQKLAYANNDYLDNPTEENKKIAEAYRKAIQEAQENNPNTAGKGGWLDKSLAGYLPQLGNQLKAGGLGGATGAVVAGGLTAAGTALLPTVGEEVLIPKATMWGFNLGSAGASAADTYKVMRGMAYQGLLDEGIDEETARLAASDEAFVNAAIEFIGNLAGGFILGTGKLAGKGFTTLLSKSGNKVLREAGEKALQKGATEVAKKATAGTIAKNIGKAGVAVGIDALGEGAEEGTQQVVSIANVDRAEQGKTGKLNLVGEAVKKASNLTDEEKAEVSEATKEGIKIGLMTGGGLKAITGVTNNAIDSHNAKVNQLENDIKEMQATYQTQQAMNAYKKLSPYSKYQPAEVNTNISTKDIKPRRGLPEGGKIYVDENGVAVDSRNYVAPSENNVQNGQYSPVNARQVIQNPINQENVEKIENQQKNVAPESPTNDFQEQGKQTILPTQKIQETVNSAKIVGMSDFDVKKAQDIHKMLQSGSNLKFYDSKNVPAGVDSRAINANGFYKDGTLWINKDSKRQVEKILGHELTHHLENTEEYSNFAKSIFDSNLFYDYITSQGYDNVEQFKENLRQRGYSDKDMDYEMVSMFAEDNLFDSQEKIDRLARENRTLAQKILNWLSDMKTKLVGTSQEKELLRIENMYRKALEQARNVDTTSTDAQYSYSGEVGLNNLKENRKNMNFAQRRFVNELESNYNTAVEMDKQGATNEQILKDTGWFKADGKWRCEIPDTLMRLKPDIQLENGVSYDLADILQHDLLFMVYPDLMTQQVVIDNDMNGNGKYNTITKNIKLKVADRSKGNIELTLLHEVQHAIQDTEGFEGGTSPLGGKLRYYEHKGEIEAADTARRLLQERQAMRKGENFDREKVAPELSKENPEHPGLKDYLASDKQTKIRDNIYKRFKGGAGNETESFDIEDVELENNETNNETLGQNNSRRRVAGREPAFSLPEKEVQDRINATMTMKDAKRMVEMAFIDNDIYNWYDGKYANGDEWLKDLGVDEIESYLDNTISVLDKYLNPLYEKDETYGDEYMTSDILQAYLDGTLVGTEKKQATRLDTSKETDYKPTKFYEPQEAKQGIELYNKASERVTNANRDEVYKARAEFIINAHNKGYIESLNLTSEEVNKKLKSWANYSKKAMDLSNRLNEGVAKQNRWTGIENSSIVNDISISNEELGKMVKEIKGDSSGWQRKYITSTMLALDTHIDYSNLTFEFDKGYELMQRSALGEYQRENDTILIGNGYLNTVAHEIGHYIDSRWARDLGLKNNYLSDSHTKTDTLSGEQKQFVENFKTFIEDIGKESYMGSKYSSGGRKTDYWQHNTEIFARFVARFTEWTRNQSTGNRYGYEDKHYQDNFTERQYMEFVKLLQEKSMLDTTAKSEAKFSLNDSEGRKLSPEQQEFFKDSKVRDEDGNLQVMYHGTNGEFTKFNKGTANGWLGKGIYLTTKKDYAKKQGKKTMAVYANLSNPFISKSDDPFSFISEVKKIYSETDDFNVAEVLQKNGYDGIIYTHWDTNVGTMVNVFEPNQIKNVDNTNPTENTDIRYSIDGKEETRTSKTKSSLLDEIAPINESKLEDVEEEKVANILTRTPKTKAKDMLRQSKDVLMRKLVDAGHTIDTVGKITGDKNLYQYFNNTKQARQSAEYMIGEAQTDIQGNRVGNSLMRVFEPIRAKGDEYTNKFFEYLLHMHNIDRMKQNKPVFGKSVTAEDSSLYVKELLKEYPEFEKAANKVYAYNRNLMQWRVDSGLISQEQADIMNEMYPHYVPTFRNVSGTAGSRVLQGGVQVANTVRKATGSNKDILPIDASMARQTMQTVQAAKRNLLGNRLLNDVLNNKEKVAEYVQAVEKTNEKTDLAEEMDNSKDSNLDLNNTFKIFRNGEAYLMQVNNGIYEGLKSISSEIDNTDTNVLLKPVKAANNMFKKLITGYSPMFTVKNFARDIQDSGLYAKSLRKFMKNYPKTYTQMIGNGDMWQLYKSLGGTGSSFFDYDSGIEKAIDSKNKLGTKIKDSTVGKIEELNMMIEQAPRFAEFMSTIEKTGNKNYDTLMEAMLNAADVTVNFGRSGTWGNFLNSTFVPFFNPSIQGFDKMGRTFLEGKAGKQFAKLAIRATLLGIAPTLINELLLGDDDDYENLSDRDKDTNFIIKLGDNKWLKIPKGRVLSIFGNTASRVLKTMRGEEWDVGEFVKNQLDQTAPISPFDSNIVSPIMAVQNNKTWYGSKIVPQRLEGYAPKDQYDEKTDAFSKWLGGKINYSPKKINYLIDAYTGIIGDVALPLTTPKAETNPFTKAFVIDGVTNNEISNDFYNMLDEYNPKQSNKESAKEVTRYLNKQSTQVNEVNKQIREIENSYLSNAEKKKQVRELRELINTIELTAMATVPQYEKAVDKYKGTFADEEVDSDYAYLFANRDIFGAEYAVKTFSKSLYNNHKDENMEKFFRNYFTREYFQKKLEPEKKSTNALPTLSNKTTNTRQLPKLSNNQNKQLPKLQK